MKNSKTSTNIHPKMKDGYEEKKTIYSNRSSCVFPVLISNINDLNIVFLNYWKIKNNLKNIVCNLRIHNQKGSIIKFLNFNLLKDHYEISIKSILRDNIDFKGMDFKGIVIIEFISSENIGFNFPAVTAFYSSKSNFSGVHTAGRIRNPEEKKIPGEIIETNWKCKWEENVTPFFTLFNGSIKSEERNIIVNILKPNKDILVSKKIPLKLNEPYSNNFFFLDKIFNLMKLNIDKNSFVEVKIPFTDFFPRMVCGNYFKEEKFLEVTHSFENQENNPDYLEELNSDRKSKLYRVPSINPIATNSELDLHLNFFPTNCIGKVFGSWRSGSFNETLNRSKENFEWITGGKDSSLKEIYIKSDNKVKALDIKKGKIPTRINTNYIYSVENASSKYSTDIAAGQITEYFPPKRFTWGHGIIGNNYKTILFLTSFSHDDECKIKTKGKLTLFLGERKYENYYTIFPESGLQINLNDLLDSDFDHNKINFVSWYYVQEKRTKLMCYWLSYTRSGKITGDHAF